MTVFDFSIDIALTSLSPHYNYGKGKKSTSTLAPALLLPGSTLGCRDNRMQYGHTCRCKCTRNNGRSESTMP